MPMPFHVEIEGESQGKIEGGCEMQGREGTMIAYAMDHLVHIPRDPQSGLPSGKRVHSPLSFVKEYDKASPLLFNALVSGEHVKAMLKWYRIDPTGMEEHYFTHELQDAIIVSIKPYTPMAFAAEFEAYRHMEEVSLTYRKIVITYEDGGVTAEDDWAAPKS